MEPHGATGLLESSTLKELAMLNKEWKNSYFFVKIREKPVCLVCSKHVTEMKQLNLQRHYDSCHSNLKN